MKSRAKVEAHGFARVFYPHRDNNTTRKLATLTLFAVFGAMWVMIGMGVATPPPYFNEAAILIAIIFGRMWDIEVTRLLDAADTWESIEESDDEE